MRRILILGCLALATGCSPLRATPPKQATVVASPKPVPQVKDCPANWTASVWVKTSVDYVEDIKKVAQSDAVYCVRYVGNSDNERTSEIGVMVEVKTDDIIDKLPKGEKALTSEEAEAIVTEVEKLQTINDTESEALLQRLLESGYDASLGSIG